MIPISELTGLVNASFAIYWKQTIFIWNFHFSIFEAAQLSTSLFITSIKLWAIPPVRDIILKGGGGVLLLSRK